MCECVCVPRVSIEEVPPRPRYHVSANKSSYVGENYDSLDEAVARLSVLASDGYNHISLRDNEAEGDIW